MSADSSQTVEVFAQPLKCQVCGHNRFWRGDAQLTDSTASAFERVIFSPDSPETIYQWVVYFACEKCGYMHWFMKASALA